MDVLMAKFRRLCFQTAPFRTISHNFKGIFR